jgi:hypothetical protein
MNDPEKLADGVVQQVVDLVAYAVPRHSRVVISALSLVNIGDSTIEVNVFATSGEARRHLAPRNLEIESGDMFQLTAPHSIEAGESLILETSLVGVLSYYLSGSKLPAVPTPTNRAQ